MADKLQYSDEQIEALLNNIYMGDVAPNSLPEDLYQATSDYLKRSLYKGFGGTLADFEGKPLELLEKLRENVYMFSSARTFQQVLEMSDALTNDEGKILSFSEFRQAAADIYSKYNGGDFLQDDDKYGYLETEYNMAFSGGQNAINWERIEREKETLPYLRKNVTEDANTCEICGPLQDFVAPVDDPVWDEIAGELHPNCRCFEEQLDEETGDDKYDKEESDALFEKQSDLMDPMFKNNPYKTGMVYNEDHSYFSVPKEYMALAENNFGLPIPPSVNEAFENFPRDLTLKGADAELQDSSILDFLQNRKEYVSDYLKANGNVINTDEARKAFIPLGYNGTNAAAVHEASSALGKEALEKLLTDGKNGRVSFYAGGAGACKTTTIETLKPGLKKTSDAIIDGNLSSYEKAARKINDYIAMGKDIEIEYVYRAPLDAWNAVIQRMLYNENEMGRAVRSSTFIETTEGSYNTVKKIINNSDIMANSRVHVDIFDNSLGKGNARVMGMYKFNAIEFPNDLKTQLRKITDGYWKEGKLTKAQYDTLIQ